VTKEQGVIEDLGIDGVMYQRLQAHGDERGRFTEIFRARAFPDQLLQANHSVSRAGVLRGLHYHRNQADLWYVVSGRAQVALADLRGRADSVPTATVVLDGDSPANLYIPPGVAHGFLALTDLSLIYWVTQEYDGSDEYGVAWNDDTLSIPWENDDPILSERDAGNPKLT
jgi:dTDP-4-dehydrorhamnose 3,5-epimerase